MSGIRAYVKLLKRNTPFSHATITALVVGVASVLVTATDLFWLIGDISHNSQPYHYIVFTGLVIGLVVMLGSFVYLHRAILRYHKKMTKRHNEQYRQAHIRHFAPTHCNVNPKKVYKIDYSRYNNLYGYDK